MSVDPQNPRNDLTAVVHDVRQMLAVITGRAGLWRRRSEDPKLQRDLKSMERAALQAEAIVARLLNVESEAPLPGVVGRTLLIATELVRPRPDTPWVMAGEICAGADEGQWVLSWQGDEEAATGVPSTVLLEVFTNLLSNSLEVMPAGGRVEVSLAEKDSTLICRFQDSGPGVAQDLAARIFDRGVSGSGDPARGVGLPACRELLAKSGGSLTLVAPAGGGACFEMGLPLSSAPQSVNISPPTSAPTFEPRVVVVDDDPVVREMLFDVLQELGCTVQVARDASSAQDLLAAGSFEMAVIDQSLPGTSGLDLAKAWRKMAPEMVLVLISGWGKQEILDTARHSVVDFVAEKPVTVEILQDLLNQAGQLSAQRLGGPDHRGGRERENR